MPGSTRSRSASGCSGPRSGTKKSFASRSIRGSAANFPSWFGARKGARPTGEYLEIERPRLLAFTWGVPQDSPETSRITVEIQPLDSGSQVTVVHEVEPDFEEEAADAWARMLMALGHLLEGEKEAS